MSKLKVKIQYIGGESRKSDFVSLVARNRFLKKLFSKHREGILSGETININLDERSILELINVSDCYLKIDYEAFESENNFIWQNQSNANRQILNSNEENKFGTQSEEMNLSGYFRNRRNKTEYIVGAFLCAIVITTCVIIAITMQNNTMEKDLRGSNQKEERQNGTEEDIEIKRKQIFSFIKEKFDKFGSFRGSYTFIVFRELSYEDCQLTYTYDFGIILSESTPSIPIYKDVDLTLLDPTSVYFVADHFEIFCIERDYCTEQIMMNGKVRPGDHEKLYFYDSSSDSTRQVLLVKDALSKLISLCQDG